MQISANGLAIEVDDQGPAAGPAIVLIMGLGMQLVAWPSTPAWCKRVNSPICPGAIPLTTVNCHSGRLRSSGCACSSATTCAKAS